MNQQLLRGGLWCALCTPMDQRGALDRAALKRLVERAVAGGVETLVVLGSTGEAATLEEFERDACIETARAAAGTVPVVVGTGHNSTAQTLSWTRRAAELGAAGALVVTPYYNRPTPAGIAAHFAALAQGVPGFPLVAYNVPARTGTNLSPKALELLWREPAVLGIKESSGDLAQIDAIARHKPADRLLLAGDDALALPSLAVGAEGWVSVVANALPGPARRLLDAALSGQRQEALSVHRRLMPLVESLALEPNPIPIKALLAHMGLSRPHLRLPLTEALESTRAALETALAFGEWGEEGA